MPIAAASQLLSFLGSTYSTSVDLIETALSRITGTRPNRIARKNAGVQEKKYVLSVHPDYKLSDAMEENTSLFVEERQNLFIDDVQEFERWTRVIRAMPASYVKITLETGTIAKWIQETLGAFIEVSHHQPCGPITWSSKLEVYVLCMRLLFTVEVLFHCQAQEADDLKNALRRFQEAGKARQMHPIWMRKVDELLALEEY